MTVVFTPRNWASHDLSWFICPRNRTRDLAKTRNACVLFCLPAFLMSAINLCSSRCRPSISLCRSAGTKGNQLPQISFQNRCAKHMKRFSACEPYLALLSRYLFLTAVFVLHTTTLPQKAVEKTIIDPARLH